MPLTFDDQQIALVDASGSYMSVYDNQVINPLSQSLYLVGSFFSGSNMVQPLNIDVSGSLLMSGSAKLLDISGSAIDVRLTGQPVNLLTQSMFLVGGVFSGSNLGRVILTDVSGTQLISGSVKNLDISGSAVDVRLTGQTVSLTTQSMFLVGGVNPSNQTQVAKTDNTGSIYVTASPVDAYRATYSATGTWAPVTTAPLDIFAISGSASKVIRITKIELSGIQTTAAYRDISLIKRSTSNTGGTATALTIVPHDSANAAATAQVWVYTANPTVIGTSVGAIRNIKALIGTAITNSMPPVIQWDFGNRPSQAIVLRGITQGLVLSLNGVASTGNAFDVSVEWTEE